MGEWSKFSHQKLYMVKSRWRRREDVPRRRRCYIFLGRCHDGPIRCRGDVPVKCLGDVPSRRRWVFYLRRTCQVTGTYRETSLRRRQDVSLPGRQMVMIQMTLESQDLLKIVFILKNMGIVKYLSTVESVLEILTNRRSQVL